MTVASRAGTKITQQEKFKCPRKKETRRNQRKKSPFCVSLKVLIVTKNHFIFSERERESSSSWTVQLLLRNERRDSAWLNRKERLGTFMNFWRFVKTTRVQPPFLLLSPIHSCFLVSKHNTDTHYIMSSLCISDKNIADRRRILAVDKADRGRTPSAEVELFTDPFIWESDLFLSFRSVSVGTSFSFSKEETPH